MKEVRINTAQEGIRQVEAMLNAFKKAGENVPVDLGEEANQIIKEVREFLASRVGPISEVRDLMKERFVGPEEIKSIWGLDVLPVRLPRDPEYGSIMNVLNSDCPFEKDKKVWETHYLTLVPMNIGKEAFNLNKLYELVGGQAGQVLKSDWFVGNEFGERTLKELADFNEKLDKAGRYVLWYKGAPEVTKDKNWEESRAELVNRYPTHRPCFTHELITGIIEIEKATGVREKLWGWCEDYFPKGVDGASSAVAISVYSDTPGQTVPRNDPSCVDASLGSTACWNFRRKLTTKS